MIIYNNHRVNNNSRLAYGVLRPVDKTKKKKKLSRRVDFVKFFFLPTSPDADCTRHETLQCTYAAMDVVICHSNKIVILICNQSEYCFTTVPDTNFDKTHSVERNRGKLNFQ